MADEFDPYHIWLGIPPKEQPANHYRLLGIALFEENPEVIRDAVMQRMAHIRTYQLGKYQALSQRILNELAAAKVCLQDPTSKAAYDENLRQRVAAETSKQAAGETSKQRGIDENFLTVLRKEKVLVVSIGLGLVGIFGIVLFALTIRVRHPDGKETMMTVPNGSQVTVSEKRNTKVAVKEDSGKKELPLVVLPPNANKAEQPKTEPPKVVVQDKPAPPVTYAKEQQDCAARLGIPVELINSIGMKFVLIPPGEFEMGSTPEEIAWALEGATEPGSINHVRSEAPRHHVKITKPFYMGSYTVTQDVYEKAMGTNPSAFSVRQLDASAFNPPLSATEIKNRQAIAPKLVGKDTSRHPVDTISWDDCVEFCHKLSALSEERNVGRTYRLPTEAEWEYACRAGTTTRWSFGDNEADLVEYGWVSKNSDRTTHPVGKKRPNAWGLFDMHGNIWQWCSDQFGSSYYKQSPLNDPAGPPTGDGHVVRSSALGNGRTCRCAFRHSAPVGFRGHTIGFRVAMEPVSKEEDQPLHATPNAASGSNAPPPAVAPFDATKAKQLQEAWAKHLGVPVKDTNSIGMELLLIPPGEFDMGSTPEEQAWALKSRKDSKDVRAYTARVSSEGPRHHVKISKPFYSGIYQVMQAEYEKVMGVNPSAFTEKQIDASLFKPPFDQKHNEERKKDAKRAAGKDTSRNPVETVSWDEAMEFCRKLSAMPAERRARRVYRLPTEAEWEYACRAGTTTRWYCGDNEVKCGDVAWFNENAGGMTHPVGLKRPNAWGLYDMYGNVWQWCADWFSVDSYKKSPPSDPIGPTAGSSHVLRGCYWSLHPSSCRSACRISNSPTFRNHTVGFRVLAGL